MELESISINNFRNYKMEFFKPGRGINVVYGDNGEGKTNLLESVYYLFSAVSHRTKRDGDLINEEESYFRIKGKALFDEGSTGEMEIIYEKGKKKKLSLNQENYSIDKYYSRFPVVVMYPQDIYLVAEGPGMRRRFLNAEIIRLYPFYYSDLMSYYRVLKQRNNILRKGSLDKGNLFLWDELLVEHGKKVICQRIDYINKLSGYADYYQKLFTDGREGLALSYKSPFSLVWEGREGRVKENEELIAPLFMERLERKREEEFKRGYTVCGPHVEDMRIIMNGRDVKKFSSQGQQRTTVIALKMAQAKLLFEEREDKPFLLLDDCLSELDEKRSNLMLEIMEKNKMQSLITTYEKLKIPSGYEASFYKVRGGSICHG